MPIIKTLLLLLALLCAFHPSPLCEAAVCYVKPTEPHNATCPSEPCQTLDEYVSNTTRYFVSNTVFMFLNGYHNLSLNVTVCDVQSITLRPYVQKSNAAVVFSQSEIVMAFESASDTVIRGLTFQRVSISFWYSNNVALTGLTAGSIELDNVSGDVSISGLTAGSIELGNVFGEVAIAGLTAGSIELDNVSGDVNISGLITAGSTDLDNVSGAVNISGLTAGSIELDNVSGDVDISGLITAGSIDLDNVSGAVNISGLTAGSIELGNVSGAVNISGLTAGSIELDNVSGAVNISGLTAGSIELKNVSGAVNIYGLITAERIELDDVSGAVNISGLAAGSIELDNVSGTVDISRLTAGSIELDNVSGAVDICRLTAGNIELDNVSGAVDISGLTAGSITLDNVIGAVAISHIKCATNFWYCIKLYWTGAQSYYTVVVLHELDLSSNGGSIGVSISGCVPGKIVLMNSTFSGNGSGNANGTGVFMQLSGPSCSNMLFVCQNTLFYKNFYGLDIEVQISQQNQYLQATAISLWNVTFIDNGAAVSLENMQNATISNCLFKGNHLSGAITAVHSILSLMGNVTFIDNHSDKGGAISLFVESLILVPEPNNTYILFESNTANNNGGAIYFSSCSHWTANCRIYLENTFSSTVFNFSKNTAVKGGNAIYGAYLENYECFSPHGIPVRNLSAVFLKASSFTPSDDHSAISSDAQSVCFCDGAGEPDCKTNQYPDLSVYPGQVFGLHIAVVGDMNGLVEWSVYTTVDLGNFSNETQQSQSTSAERCTNVHYSILSNESLVHLKFSLNNYQSIDDNNYSVRPVFLLDCPLGFSLHSNNYGCCCHEHLLQNIENITCNITEQSIQRQGTTWIGILKNTSNLVFSAVCPFLYCNQSSVNINLNNESTTLTKDTQCTGNRSGVLCGGCRDNFSLALGSNRCLHGCSNNSLSLIIAFAAAGIALVFFIKILNLTVSQGTINGLIFYANIVGAEQTMLFSSKTYKGFLSVFIAWVNLDLGIETCFFDGMDAYAKVWLQFVFPVYVWAIALFIIIISHYSIRIAKLFGNNSVPVLATLILLSYSKLLQTVISALSTANIQFLNGSTMSVWERDGNIQYLTGKHIPLFVLAVAVIVLLFPFTLILVSVQWLQKGTHYRVLCWVDKLMPLFDAFTGPLKDKHHYWAGALLLARCILIPIIYIFSANGSGVATVSLMFAVLFALVFLAASGFVYRNYSVTVLELSYILNLGILATGTLYIQYISNSGNQEALVITSVGIAILLFVVTVIYHAYVQLREFLKKCKSKRLGEGIQEETGYVNEPQREDYEPLEESSSIYESYQLPPVQDIKFDESLFGYYDD